MTYDQESWHLTEMTQPQAERMLRAGMAVLVTGSVEQHGSHLPLGTDAFAALTIAERVAARIEAPLLQLSAVGVAPYHAAWPGSLTLSPTTFIGLLTDVCTGLAAAGVKRMLLVNWHEGNTPSMRLAADEVQRRVPVRVVVAEGHVITNMLFPDEMEFTHAGAMETAAVLAHRPSLVRLDELTAGDPVASGNDAHALFRRRDVFPVLRDFREVASTGWYGTPGRIEQERAEEILEAVADYVAEEFASVCTQLGALEQRRDGDAPTTTGTVR